MKSYVKKHKVKLHLDGARVWNAVVSLGIPIDQYVKDFDLVNVCLSKGLGCPLGTMIAGTEADMQ